MSAKKAESDGAVTRCYAIYASCLAKKWGIEAPVTVSAPAVNHLKDLVAARGEYATTQAIYDFFASDDPQVTRSNYTIEDIAKWKQR